MENSISAYMQVYKHQRAVFEALRSFRTHYRTEPITIVSDNGDDFTDMCQVLNVRFIHSNVRTVTGPADQRTLNRMTLEGIYISMERLYEHCVSVDTDWVVFLGPDVRTIRRIREFPTTPWAGARENTYSPELVEYLRQKFGPMNYVYGMAGGGIFRRQAFIDCWEGNRNLEEYVKYDERIAIYDDMAYGLLFFINGFDYSVWDDVSEILHETAPIVRDSAFDHGYKYWYDKDYDEEILKEIGASRLLN